MMSSRKLRGFGKEKPLSAQEQQDKINEVRNMIGPVAPQLPHLCSDESVSRYLRARCWNTKKAFKMLRETLKWRLQFKPEKLRWEDIAREAETGKVYRANYLDKNGRTVLVMRPGFQNTTGVEGQIKHLVYCMENAIMCLNPEQEQMVWLIDFQGWSMASISLKAARETANVLQNHYPERLAIGILYNPPKVFESFWTMVKPFLEPKTNKKVKFAYSKDPASQKLMEELFDMDNLESTFGGKNTSGFNYEAYAQWMKEDDKKMSELDKSGFASLIPSIASESHHSCDDDDNEENEEEEEEEEDGNSSLIAGNGKEQEEDEKAEPGKEVKASELVKEN